MSQYLLACECGQQVPVDIRQAGGRVICSCGSPARRAAAAKNAAFAAGCGRGSSSRHAVEQAEGCDGRMHDLGCSTRGREHLELGTQPKIPMFDPAEHERLIDENLKKLTPPDSWTLWIDYYRPLAERGFPIFEARNRAEIEREIAHRQFLRRSLWVVAGILAAIAVAAAFWPARRG